MKKVILAAMAVAMMAGSVFARPLTDVENQYLETNYIPTVNMYYDLMPGTDTYNNFITDSIQLTYEVEVKKDAATTLTLEAVAAAITPQLEQMIADKQAELLDLIGQFMDWKSNIMVNL